MARKRQPLTQSAWVVSRRRCENEINESLKVFAPAKVSIFIFSNFSPIIFVSTPILREMRKGKSRAFPSEGWVGC